MKDDKNTEFVEPAGKFEKWFENFWYHYKVQSIIGLVAVFTVIICTVQLLTKERFDYNTIYAGPQIIAVQDMVYIQRAISTVGEDLNGDGEVKTALNDIVMLSPEEQQQAKENGAVLDDEFIRTQMNQYYQLLMSRDSSIMFLSPYMYSQAYESGCFMKLSEIFDEVPDSAYDDSSIVLSKTEFGQSFNGIDDLPADTVICIRKLTAFENLKNSKEAKENNEEVIKLFKSIVNYTK